METQLTLGAVNGDEQKSKHGKPKGNADYLTYDELKKLVSIPDRRTNMGKRDYAILLIFCETPMRRGEVCSLKRADILDEGEKKFITYRGLKKRRKEGDQPYYLKIDISNHTYEAIKSVMALDVDKTPGSPLFYTTGIRGPHEKGPITPYAIHVIIKKYAKLAGINKRISPHSFRATWVTLRAQEHDIFTLKDAGGWSSVDAVMPYARKVRERIRNAALAFPVGVGA